MLEAALAAEALGAVVAPAPFLGTAVLAPLALMLAATDGAAGALAAEAGGGRGARSASAISEPMAGAPDGAGVRPTAAGCPGKALFALDAGAAHDLLVVADRTAALHLAPMRRGVSTPMRRSIDAHAAGSASSTFDDAPRRARWTLRTSALRRARAATPAWIVLAADTLGAAQAMLDKAVAYAKERKQFGRTIGSFQAVKHLLRRDGRRAGAVPRAGLVRRLRASTTRRTRRR